jgi:hypothetical protein
MDKKTRIEFRNQAAKVHAQTQGPFANAADSFSAGYDLATLEINELRKVLDEAKEFVSSTPYEGSVELLRKITKVLNSK